VQPAIEHFKPLSHKRIIKTLLEEVGKCFYTQHAEEKQDEVVALAKILE
jgi:hypothetical protein